MGIGASARGILADGRSPIEARKTSSSVPTFGEMADRVVDSRQHEWRNEKHRAQWRSTLKTYAAPIRAKRVEQITTEDVPSLLKPVWTEKPETTSRVRGRIERVLDGHGHAAAPHGGQGLYRPWLPLFVP